MVVRKLKSATSQQNNRTEKITDKKDNKKDLKIYESILNEKNDLKSENNRITRENGRMNVMIKDLNDLIQIKDENLMILTNKVGELDMTDRVSVLKSLVPEEKERINNAMYNKSLVDMRQLIEKVIIDNIKLKKEVNHIKAQILIKDS